MEIKLVQSFFSFLFMNLTREPEESFEGSNFQDGRAKGTRVAPGVDETPLE